MCVHGNDKNRQKNPIIMHSSYQADMNGQTDTLNTHAHTNNQKRKLDVCAWKWPPQKLNTHTHTNNQNTCWMCVQGNDKKQQQQQKPNLIHTLTQTTKTHAGCVCKETTKKLNKKPNLIHTLKQTTKTHAGCVCKETTKKLNKKPNLIHTLTQTTKTHAGCVCKETTKN